MPDIELKIDRKQLREILDKINRLKPEERNSIIYKWMLNATNLVERKLKLNLAGQILNVRSGKLRQSIGSRVFANETGITGLVGSGVRTGKRMVYANIHETGGMISATKSKYLTIPLDAAKTAAGAPRKAKARDWPNTFILRTKGGELLIVQKNGKKGIIPLYILKKSVNIPKRRYLSRTLEQMQNRILTLLGSYINTALKERSTNV